MNLSARIPAELYQHPEERASFLALSGIGWLSGLPKLFVMSDLERDYRLLNLADNLLLRPEDQPRLHGALDRVLEVLEFPARPELYLACDPKPSSHSFGETQPVIVLNSGLLQMLEPEEQHCVLAHEVGHLASGHSFFQLIAQNFASLTQLSGIIPFAGAVSFGARLPLYEWYRKADLSADRAALAVCGDPGLLVRTIARLSGSPGRAVSEEGLVEQARLFDRVCGELKAGSMRDRATYYFSTLFLQGFLRTQPYPAVRVREILAWSPSAVCRALQERDLATARSLLEQEKNAQGEAGNGGGAWSVTRLWEDFTSLFGKGELPGASPPGPGSPSGMPGS